MLISVKKEKSRNAVEFNDKHFLYQGNTMEKKSDRLLSSKEESFSVCSKLP